jgi:tetratricopeptide (TPR) repeat protein
MPREYAELRRQALAAAERGDLASSAERWREAAAAAQAHGCRDLADQAVASRWAALIELGEGSGAPAELRRILMAAHDPLSRFLAAYTLARVLELQRDWKKALFYARIAAQNAPALTPVRQSASQNLMGNLLLAESRVEEALACYGSAFALMPESDALWRARILDNLGYCRALQGAHQDALRLLWESLRIYRGLAVPRYEITCRLALAYTHLQTDRWWLAERHARIAVEHATAVGDLSALRNALYLQGAAAQLAGDLDRARASFRELDRLYGAGSELAELMVHLDLRQLVNLRA